MDYDQESEGVGCAHPSSSEANIKRSINNDASLHTTIRSMITALLSTLLCHPRHLP